MRNITVDKIKAIVLGHAIGDALGVPFESVSREELNDKPITEMEGFGRYMYPAGTWSDDTSMTLCALDSLAKDTLDLEDIMVNFGRWYYKNEFTPFGETFGVGRTCRAAIDNYFKKNIDVTHCGLTDELSNGNGSLMRCIPFALYGYYHPNMRRDIDEVGSALTHAHLRSKIACHIYSSILTKLIDNPCKDMIQEGIKEAKHYYGDTNEWKYYENLLLIKKRDREAILSTGYVVHTLEAALWCVLNTETYKDCILTAVNLGGDTDTVAAVAGGLAGALYGLDNIPLEWLNTLQKRDYIEFLCEKAFKMWSHIDSLNICDTHMHVIPCFDDGSESLEMSLEMLADSYRQGVRRVFCTSHSWYDIIEKEKYDQAFEKLKKEAKIKLPNMELFTGCEIYCEYDDIEEITELLDSGVLHTMNNTKYVLTEFYPDVGREEATMIVSSLLLHGYIPIIAHAERYWELRIVDISAFVEMGCKIQINLFSLSEESDKRTKLNAEMYCKSGLVNFVGSDAHRTNHRPPKILSGLNRLYEICDEKYVRKICFENSNILAPVVINNN